MMDYNSHTECRGNSLIVMVIVATADISSLTTLEIGPYPVVKDFKTQF